MGAHPGAFAHLADQIKDATRPDVIDSLLDQWWDIQHRATEWDAEKWGFDPDRWMSRERAEMRRRAFAPPSSPAKKLA